MTRPRRRLPRGVAWAESTFHARSRRAFSLLGRGCTGARRTSKTLTSSAERRGRRAEGSAGRDPRPRAASRRAYEICTNQRPSLSSHRRPSARARPSASANAGGAAPPRAFRTLPHCGRCARASARPAAPKPRPVALARWRLGIPGLNRSSPRRSEQRRGALHARSQCVGRARTNRHARPRQRPQGRPCRGGGASYRGRVTSRARRGDDSSRFRRQCPRRSSSRASCLTRVWTAMRRLTRGRLQRPQRPRWARLCARGAGAAYFWAGATRLHAAETRHPRRPCRALLCRCRPCHALRCRCRPRARQVGTQLGTRGPRRAGGGA